jgi:hypothetical protein
VNLNNNLLDVLMTLGIILLVLQVLLFVLGSAALRGGAAATVNLLPGLFGTALLLTVVLVR